MPFVHGEITVTAVDDRYWRLDRVVVYQPADGGDLITVPAGFRTDFATVPRVLWWLMPRTGKHDPAAVVHDWLCEHPEITSRRDADRIFRRILAELDVPLVLRWLCWSAVRFGGGAVDPRAVLIGLVALPVLAPPVLLVTLALGVYTVAEWLAGLVVGG